jgi:hypothetical protein
VLIQEPLFQKLVVVESAASIFVNVEKSEVKVLLLDSKKSINPLLSQKKIFSELLNMVERIFAKYFVDEVIPDLAAGLDLLKIFRSLRFHL